MELENSSHEIKQLRIRMGWCQSELAQKMNVSVDVIKGWEVGKDRPNSEQCKELDHLIIKSELSTFDMISSAHNDSQNT